MEPHKGHEVAYNRWYERDHFYSGCMIGPWQFAGKRFVATADLKKLRDPDPSAITGGPDRGSYVAVYWVLDGHHDDWNLWAVDQVRALHKQGRMFDERDHVHTLLYKYRFEVGREADPVPAELALDHPYKGMVAMWVDAPKDVPEQTARGELETRLREEHLPAVLPGSRRGTGRRYGSPCPCRSTSQAWHVPSRSIAACCFSGSSIASRGVLDATVGKLRRRIEEAGHGTVIAIAAFHPDDARYRQVHRPALARRGRGARDSETR